MHARRHHWLWCVLLPHQTMSPSIHLFAECHKLVDMCCRPWCMLASAWLMTNCWEITTCLPWVILQSQSQCLLHNVLLCYCWCQVYCRYVRKICTELVDSLLRQTVLHGCMSIIACYGITALLTCSQPIGYLVLISHKWNEGHMCYAVYQTVCWCCCRVASAWLPLRQPSCSQNLHQIQRTGTSL